MIENFYELARQLESLQSDLEDAWKAHPENRKRRREILSTLKSTLATMHEEHRLWLDSLAETDERRQRRPKPRQVQAA